MINDRGCQEKTSIDVSGAHLEAVEVVVVVVLVALLAGGGARVRRRVGGGRAGRARRAHPAAAVDRAVQAVSVDLLAEVRYVA